MRAPVLFIPDNPERADAMRRSALDGRPVYLWVEHGRRPPAWARPVRGDAEVSGTYAELRGSDAIVVVDVADGARAVRIAAAARAGLPGAPVLIIDRSRGRRRRAMRGVTWIDEGELLADAVETMLRLLVSRRRPAELRDALQSSDRCAFLVQHDPDPDAIASSLALRQLLELDPDHSPIISFGWVTRPENKRLLAELGARVRHVSHRQLPRFGPLVLVDVQPPYFGELLADVAAVVDHHPVVAEYKSRFRDVRTSYGASATMAAEYLLAEGDPGLITRPLATALLYGIITDTKSLSRAASDEDLQMFAYLFPRADQAVLRRIQHPSYTRLALERFGDALQRARVRGGIAYVHLGELPEAQEHIVAQLAEFCLGMEGASVSAVSGVFGGRLVMSTRALHPEAQLGQRLKGMFDAYGSAGGHPIMAKAVVDLGAWRTDHPFNSERELERRVLAELHRSLKGRSSRPC